LLSIGLQAQVLLTPEEEEALYEQRVAAEEAAIANRVKGFRDQCDVGINVAVSTIFFEDYVEIQIESDKSGTYYLVDESNKDKTKLQLVQQKSTYLTLPLGRTFAVVGNDNCNKDFVATQFSTSQQNSNDPITVVKRQYDAIVDWQKENGAITFDESIQQNNTLTDFDKTFLVQQISLQGQPFMNNPNRHPVGKNDIQNKDLKLLNCSCRTVRLANAYLLTPIVTIRDDGRISGVYGSRSETRQRGRLRLFRAWAFEGPSRYTELFGNSSGCAKIDEQWGWNLDQDADIVQINMDNGESIGIDPFLEASIEYNLVCQDRDGNKDDDCECEREVSFEFDYESVVRAQAEVVRGGLFCGAVREAVAGAVDYMTVTTEEIDDSTTVQLVAGLINGQAAQCNQVYNGPSFADFAAFAFSAVNLSQDFSDVASQVDFVEGLRVIFGENWLDTDGCRNDLVGRTRRLPTGNRVANMTLFQNRPIKITLAAGGSMVVGGQRKWIANARIHSSFRLSGIVIGRKDVETNSNNSNCCSPYFGSWLMSTIASDVGGSREEAFGARIRSHFATNAIEQRVWTETGNFIDFDLLDCNDVEVEVIITGPGVQDDEEIIVTKNANGVVVTTSQLDVSNRNLSYTLFDAAGRRISEQSASGTATTLPQTTFLPRGIYFIRVTSNGKLIHTIKAAL
jgi:hypothetical protein